MQAVSVLLFGLLTFAWTSPSLSGERPSETPAVLERLQQFVADPSKHLGEIAVLADRGARLVSEELDSISEERRAIQSGRPLAELGGRELKEYHQAGSRGLSRRDLRGFELLRRISADAALLPAGEDRATHLQTIREIILALANGRRSPTREEVDLVGFTAVLWDQLRNPVGVGRWPASNVEPGTTRVELDRIDPRQSSFWTPPVDVSGLDLHHGFGRERIPDVESELWDYAGPKTSFGSNPGFDLRSRLGRLKVKFGETFSEPFAARVFWALGYHVEPVDHARRLRIRYDRRLFREFHLRRELETRFSIFRGLPVFKVRWQPHWDPFAFIDHAVLLDGTCVEGALFRRMLLWETGSDRPEDDPENFRREFEARIDHLVTIAANVQFREEDAMSVGPWDFGQLDHADRREVRGMALLAAWLGWYDSRFENTRLKLKVSAKGLQLEHVISDLGGGLGRGEGFFSGRGELPEVFEWTFSRPGGAGPGRKGRVRITGFKPIEDTPAFEEMTWDDARWMARWIARLTEAQLEQALVAAGLDSTRARLYREKLISRRDTMIRDLDLAGEIGLLRPAGVDRHFNYDPAVDGPFIAPVPNGGVEEAPVVPGLRIEGGRLVERREGRAPPRRRAASARNLH